MSPYIVGVEEQLAAEFVEAARETARVAEVDVADQHRADTRPVGAPQLGAVRRVARLEEQG